VIVARFESDHSCFLPLNASSPRSLILFTK
jgi:hypothetical protein